MRLAFPRRLPDRVVTATVKREPIDIPNATANVSRQHAKLSVPLPTSQVLSPLTADLPEVYCSTGFVLTICQDAAAARTRRAQN